MKVVMLSTNDNPHSPIDDFNAWYAWDVAAGYHTTEYLGRLLSLSPSLPPYLYHKIVEETIDEIIKENILGIYIKVEKEVED